MIYIGIAAVFAGIVQGITGFGAGIVMMMILPMVLGSIPQSAGVSTAICVILSLQMIFLYRKHVDVKKGDCSCCFLYCSVYASYVFFNCY